MTYSPLALLARGEARFTGDLPLPPGTLHAMVAVSPQAHARFSGIERSAALAEPGVVAVLTAADIPGTNDIGNLFRGEPLLAVEEVHCVGEPYALVVADSADAAWRGARKLSADWQPLPAIFDVRAAYAADQLIQPPRTFALGDVDAAWANCTTIVSGRVELGSAEHVYMETQCALAIPRDDGGLKSTPPPSRRAACTRRSPPSAGCPCTWSTSRSSAWAAASAARRSRPRRGPASLRWLPCACAGRCACNSIARTTCG
jgi:xanthine dehydrogenase large subunit